MIFILFLVVSSVFCGTINVFLNGSVPGDVGAAAVLAAANVAQVLTLPYDVNMGVQWLSLGGVLVDSGTSYYCAHPMYPLVLIPPALFVQANGSTCFGGSNIHLYVRISSDASANWYTGSNPSAITSKQNDLVTYIMQQIVRGLGMKSGIVDGAGNNGYGNRSVLYDYFVFRTNNVASWPALGAPVPSPAVTDTLYLTDGRASFAGNGSHSTFPLYTPATFTVGVSLQYRTVNGLMYYAIPRGQYWRTIDMNIAGMLSSLGYNVTGCSTPDACGNCVGGNPCFLLTSSSHKVESFLSFEF